MNRFRPLSLAVAFGLLPLSALTAAPSVALTLVVQVPQGTPADQALYLGANINGWTPGDPNWRLPAPTGGVSRATFTVPQGFALEFKVTRGSWETVEKDAQGQEIPNRTWSADRDETVTVVVESWRDGGPAAPGLSTVTGRVEVVTDGPRPPLGDRRTLRIRLPGGYQTGTQRFSVLYMFDGQNLFDAATSFAGEWKVDETLSELEKEGKVPPTIVVGIDNAGADRLTEYSPYSDPRIPHPAGRAFADWLVGTLKPWVDGRYRTLADPAHTAVAGSSMGALIAVATAQFHPGVFGQVAGFSGAYWIGARGLLADLAAGGFDPKTRVYLDVGTKEAGPEDENRQMVQDSRDVATALTAAGVSQLRLVVDEGAAHNEGAWARRFGPAYQWLTGPGE
jgi:predicted alpha/beta superfamily hydrolase